MLIVDILINTLRNAAQYNSDVEVAPACILWPDREHQWEAVIPRLQIELPELFVLGDYDPEKRTGPAIWLRCVVAGKTDDVSTPSSLIPILYLPGVSRQDLRAVENCLDHLKPISELQYRGVIWSQLNAKDWTLLAFFKSVQGGLGLDVAQGNDTKSAMQLALYRLLDEKIDHLRGKRLDKDYFNTLLTGGDPVRDLLQWINSGEDFKDGRDENEWQAFVEVCKSQLGFNPIEDGVLIGVARLATHAGPWKPVWERFCEAPIRYPNIPIQLRKCVMPTPDIISDEKSHGGWPQWNEIGENILRQELTEIDTLPPYKAREALLELEKRHAGRRSLVWAELGEAPLAMALKHLAVLAETTSTPLAAGSTEDLAAGYSNFGWRVDDAVVQSMVPLAKQEDFEAVKTVIRAIYLPWAEESARYLQIIVDESGYPGGSINSQRNADYKDGECILFVDGLRMDTAKTLAGLLLDYGCKVNEQRVWATLPSVTSTGKAAVTPVRDKIGGKDFNADFEPCVSETGQSLKGGYHLKKMLTDAGWKILERSSIGDGQGNAWCEFGDLDQEGHNRGWKLAKHLDGLLKEIRDRIVQLLSRGWKRVRIVTDHGWLLLPGGLPKIDLPSALTENKWGRCASLKPGAATNGRLYPWYWNTNHHFALADGIGCYRKGEEYAHGGLSLQECLILELGVTSGKLKVSPVTLKITDIVWKGLRCAVVVEGESVGLSLDIRSQPGNPSSSLVVSVKPLKDHGTASVVVEDEDLEGTIATVVILNEDGEPVAQADTVIGVNK